MTEFDKLAFAERLIELHRERGDEMTVESVLQRAKGIAKRRGWELEDALQTMEDTLLNMNPSPENWNVD